MNRELTPQMKIGFFDSGLGGLTILAATRAHLSRYDYVYYGDTAHLPYGDKSEEEIFAYTKTAILHLFEQGAALVIIACNTASAETLRKLQDTILEGEYVDRRILGVIVPTVEALIATSAKRVLLIGTRRTIASCKYERELEKHRVTDIVLHTHATPELVPLIESDNFHDAYTYVEKLLTPWVGEVEALILGCTHYTTLKEHIRTYFKNAFQVISQDEIIPPKIEEYLTRHTEIESRLSRNGTLEILLSKESEIYDRITANLLNCRE